MRPRSCAASSRADAAASAAPSTTASTTASVPAPPPASTDEDEPPLPRWVDAEDGGPGWTEADEAWLDSEDAGPPRADAPSPRDAPTASWAAPLPKLMHWAEPAPAVLPAAVPPASVRARDEVADAHEQFWREEAQATTARAAGVSPIEVLLPTAALLILLLAVLLLIG